MSRSVHRSAGSGRFVSNAAAARWPTKTTTERVGSGTSNNRTVYRDAGTGQFVTRSRNDDNPGETIAQRV
jgi:hypothetical protein